MSQRFIPRKHILALSIASLCTSGAYAQATTEETVATPATTVVVTGTRVSNRTVLDTASPVDVISADTLKNAGTTEINQALSVALPSLNFPRPALADGTDTIRPATLRGMAPDQTLVLVNSKRRHSSSLVNLNGTIGRGSSAVDLNTIPTAIVKNIEVLRDGAAAQYGSDAISGVINLRLRTDRTGGEATVNYGARFTEYDLLNAAAPAGGTWTAPNSRKRTDGQSANISAWKGLAWGDTGFVTIAAEYKDQPRQKRRRPRLRWRSSAIARLPKPTSGCQRRASPSRRSSATPAIISHAMAEKLKPVSTSTLLTPAAGRRRQTPRGRRWRPPIDSIVPVRRRSSARWRRTA